MEGKGNDFYPDCVAAAPPSFPKQIHGASRLYFEYLRSQNTDICFLRCCFVFLAGCSSHHVAEGCVLLLFASHFNFRGFCHNVASQCRRVATPRAEEVGRKKSPNIIFLVTMACVRNPSIQSLH